MEQLSHPARMPVLPAPARMPVLPASVTGNAQVPGLLAEEVERVLLLQPQAMPATSIASPYELEGRVMTEKLCWDCTRDLEAAAPQLNDFYGLCGRNENVRVPCDGCGEVIWVDRKGRRVSGTGVRLRQVKAS